MENEKMIIVVYLGVGNSSRARMEQYILDVNEHVNSNYYENIIHYVIPVQNTYETRLELLNPKLVTPEIYNDAVLLFEQCKVDMEEAIKDIKGEEVVTVEEKEYTYGIKPETLKERLKIYLIKKWKKIKMC